MTNNTEMIQAEPVYASSLRRVGAIVSDSLVVLGLLVLSSFLIVPGLLFALQKKALVVSEVGWGWTALYWGLLLGLWVGYFVWCWSHRGQTVGMRAWRLKMVSAGGEPVSRKQAFQRWSVVVIPWIPGLLVLRLSEYLQSTAFEIAGFGLIFLAVLSHLAVGRQGRHIGWQDGISATRIILLPKL